MGRGRGGDGEGEGGDERRTRVDSPQFKYTSPLLTCCSYFTHFQLQIQTFIAFWMLFSQQWYRTLQIEA
jgi:hypothetical protein